MMHNCSNKLEDERERGLGIPTWDSLRERERIRRGPPVILSSIKISSASSRVFFWSPYRQFPSSLSLVTLSWMDFYLARERERERGEREKERGRERGRMRIWFLMCGGWGCTFSSISFFPSLFIKTKHSSCTYHLHHPFSSSSTHSCS